MPGKKGYGVTQEAFCLAWASSETSQEVSRKTGMPIAIVHARASSYRKLGIQLKKLRRVTKKRLDVEALNRMMKLIEGEKDHKQRDTAKPAAHSVQALIDELIKR